MSEELVLKQVHSDSSYEDWIDTIEYNAQTLLNNAKVLEPGLSSFADMAARHKATIDALYANLATINPNTPSAETYHINAGVDRAELWLKKINQVGVWYHNLYAETNVEPYYDTFIDQNGVEQTILRCVYELYHNGGWPYYLYPNFPAVPMVCEGPSSLFSGFTLDSLVSTGAEPNDVSAAYGNCAGVEECIKDSATNPLIQRNKLEGYEQDFKVSSVELVTTYVSGTGYVLNENHSDRPYKVGHMFSQFVLCGRGYLGSYSDAVDWGAGSLSDENRPQGGGLLEVDGAKVCSLFSLPLTKLCTDNDPRLQVWDWYVQGNMPYPYKQPVFARLPFADSIASSSSPDNVEVIAGYDSSTVDIAWNLRYAGPGFAVERLTHNDDVYSIEAGVPLYVVLFYDPYFNIIGVAINGILMEYAGQLSGLSVYSAPTLVSYRAEDELGGDDTYSNFRFPTLDKKYGVPFFGTQQLPSSESSGLRYTIGQNGSISHMLFSGGGVAASENDPPDYRTIAVYTFECPMGAEKFYSTPFWTTTTEEGTKATGVSVSSEQSNAKIIDTGLSPATEADYTVDDETAVYQHASLNHVYGVQTLDTEELAPASLPVTPTTPTYKGRLLYNWAAFLNTNVHLGESNDPVENFPYNWQDITEVRLKFVLDASRIINTGTLLDIFVPEDPVAATDEDAGTGIRGDLSVEKASPLCAAKVIRNLDTPYTLIPGDPAADPVIKDGFGMGIPDTSVAYPTYLDLFTLRLSNGFAETHADYVHLDIPLNPLAPCDVELRLKMTEQTLRMEAYIDEDLTGVKEFRMSYYNSYFLRDFEDKDSFRIPLACKIGEVPELNLSTFSAAGITRDGSIVYTNSSDEDDLVYAYSLDNLDNVTESEKAGFRSGAVLGDQISLEAYINDDTTPAQLMSLDLEAGMATVPQKQDDTNVDIAIPLSLIGPVPSGLSTETSFKDSGSVPMMFVLWKGVEYANYAGFNVGFYRMPTRREVQEVEQDVKLDRAAVRKKYRLFLPKQALGGTGNDSSWWVDSATGLPKNYVPDDVPPANEGKKPYTWFRYSNEFGRLPECKPIGVAIYAAKTPADNENEDGKTWSTGLCGG